MKTSKHIVSITGDVRSGEEFQFEKSPSNMAQATFIALIANQLVVTRRAADLFNLPDDALVIAHWHGQFRTDGFAMTVKLLKAKAKEWASNVPHGTC